MQDTLIAGSRAGGHVLADWLTLHGGSGWLLPFYLIRLSSESYREDDNEPMSAEDAYSQRPEVLSSRRLRSSHMPPTGRVRLLQVRGLAPVDSEVRALSIGVWTSKQ